MESAEVSAVLHGSAQSSAPERHPAPHAVAGFDAGAAAEFVLDGEGSFPGVHGFFALLERKKYKLHVRVMLSKYRGYALCPECKGQRLRAEARAVRLGDGGEGKNICEAAALTIARGGAVFLDAHAHADAGGDCGEAFWRRFGSG